LKDFLRM